MLETLHGPAQKSICILCVRSSFFKKIPFQDKEYHAFVREYLAAVVVVLFLFVFFFVVVFVYFSSSIEIDPKISARCLSCSDIKYALLDLQQRII